MPPTYTETLVANNAALVEMNRVLGRLEKQMKRNNKITKETNKVNTIAEEVALTRGKATTALVRAYEKEGKALNILQKNVFETYKTFDTFREIIGAKGKIGSFIALLEYADLALTSTSQSVKLFGFEAATARKVMYGFLPPGMFRLVNQASTGLRFIAGALRQISGEGEEANNIFTTLGKGFRKIDVSGAFAQIGEKKKRKQTVKDIEEEGGIFGDLFLSPEKRTKLALNRQYLKEKRTPFQKMSDKIPAVSLKIEKAKTYLEFKYLQAQMKTKELRKKFLHSAIKWNALTMKEKGKTIADQFIKLIKTPLMQMLITGMVYLSGIAIVMVLLRKTIWPALKDAFKAFKENAGILLAGLMNVWNGIKEVFTGLINGDLMMMLDGVFNIAWGLIQIALGVLYAGAIALFTLAWKTIANLFDGAIQFISDTFTSVKGFKENFGKLALVIIAAIAFFFGLPVALTALGVVVIMAGLKWIWGKIKGIGLFASGGMANNGMAVVGEKGPELVSLPRGSRVHSNSNSKRMAGGGTVNNFNITINAKDSSKEEMRRMANEIGRMISSKINRSTSSSTLR